jgi:hypothetical protein
MLSFEEEIITEILKGNNEQFDSIYFHRALEIEKKHNIIDFLIKNSSVNRISNIAYILRHKFANRIEDID